MRDQELLRQIAALNPVTTAELAGLDAAAGAALRKGIVMTTQAPVRTTRRRIGSRAALTGGLAVTLLGGSVAYAAVESGWFEHSGGHEGLTCFSEWADPAGVDVERAGLVTGGPPLTGNPVADCQQYQALSGRPAIEDPVAFQWDGPGVYVAPRPQVPADATVLVPRGDDGRVHELSLSITDYLGGLGSRCLGTDDAVAAARAELDRLGLTEWQVQVTPREEGRPVERCADLHLGFDPMSGGVAAAGDGVGGDATSRSLLVVPEGGVDREDLRGTEIPESVFELRDALRARITGACLDLGAARAVVDAELGDLHHWPTASVVDPDADCTRAYLQSGGSLQVTLYGPESVG